jgi:hypothetical protein
VCGYPLLPCEPQVLCSIVQGLIVTLFAVYSWTLFVYLRARPIPHHQSITHKQSITLEQSLTQSKPPFTSEQTTIYFRANHHFTREHQSFTSPPTVTLLLVSLSVNVVTLSLSIQGLLVVTTLTDSTQQLLAVNVRTLSPVPSQGLLPVVPQAPFCG